MLSVGLHRTHRHAFARKERSDILKLKRIATTGVTLALMLGATDVALSQQRSAVACTNQANAYAHQAGQQGQMLKGAGVGSLIGLGLGAIGGVSGVGAAIGGTVGLIGGGMQRQDRERQLYDAAYRDCMAGIR